MFYGVFRGLLLSQLVGKVSAGSRGGAGTVRSILSVIEMSMGFLPVLPAGGMDMLAHVGKGRRGCSAAHSAEIPSSPILSRGAPDRWSGGDSHSPAYIHEKHSRRVLPGVWRPR